MSVTHSFWAQGVFAFRLRRALFTASLLLFVMSPSVVHAGSSTLSVSAGFGFTCVADTTGSLQCMGTNTFGQFGNNDKTAINPTPIAGGFGITNAISLASGDNHTCALLADGTVQCFGKGDAGQLGNGLTILQQLTPVSVTGISSATQLSTFDRHTCALLADGRIKCWGLNGAGQIGNGTAGGTVVTPEFVSGISNATDVSAGTFFTCAVLGDGSVKCWGLNQSGILGTGSSNNVEPLPGTVLGLSNATAVSVGRAHACAVVNGGEVYCWGNNSSGQLGDGTTTLRSQPVQVSGINNAVDVSLGDNTSCALLSTGKVQCWGFANGGRLGDGGNGTYINENSLTPVTVIKDISNDLENVVQIEAGSTHTCAVLDTGELFCWGINSNGQLGDGTTEFQSTPVRVIGFDGTGPTPTPIPAPEISVSPTTIPFGSQEVGEASTPVGVTITNNGDAPLTMSSVALTAGNTNDFTIGTPPVSPVAAGGSTSFEVAFTPTETGTRTATVTIVSNDLNMSPTTVSVTGTGTVPQEPDIKVVQTSSSDPFNPPIAFDPTEVGQTSVPIEFTISNEGLAPLTINDPAVTLTGDTNFAISIPQQPQPTTLNAGESITFSVTFTPDTVQNNYSATVSIASNDPDEPVVSFALEGEGIAPDVDVAGLSDQPNLTHDFDMVTVGSNRDVTFDIRNTGAADLELTDSPIVKITGTDADQFFVLSQPTESTVVPNDSTAFTVRFGPTSAGVKTAMVSIDSNDTDENPFTFTITGEGTAAPVPEFDLVYNSNTVFDGANIDLGLADIGDNQTLTFTIVNSGTAALSLAGSPFVDITNDADGEFSVSSQPTTPIGTGSDTDFIIEVTPTVAGTKTVDVSILNNDSDEGGFSFSLSIAVMSNTPVNYCPDQSAAIDYTPLSQATCSVASSAKKFTLLDNDCNPIRGAIVTLLKANGRPAGVRITNQNGVANFGNRRFSRRNPNSFQVRLGSGTFTTPDHTYSSGYVHQAKRIEVRFVDPQCTPITDAWVFFRDSNNVDHGFGYTNNNGEVSIDLVTDQDIKAITSRRGEFIYSDLANGSQRIEISQEDEAMNNPNPNPRNGTPWRIIEQIQEKQIEQRANNFHSWFRSRR